MFQLTDVTWKSLLTRGDISSNRHELKNHNLQVKLGSLSSLELTFRHIDMVRYKYELKQLREMPNFTLRVENLLLKNVFGRALNTFSLIGLSQFSYQWNVSSLIRLWVYPLI
ncbi:CLUMA_CG010098, isoform A [Clunio marinus]|uniref:CLUMA_CG010098, isoform A n=1 Tax=Clunio marinus TaxID=568069 RepID=A0A1J1IAW2_9DIPT|nr:CLUMA_CG010098, isoform A [Clunio marinus]